MGKGVELVLRSSRGREGEREKGREGERERGREGERDRRGKRGREADSVCTCAYVLERLCE